MFFYKMYLSLTFVFQTNRPILTGEAGSSNHFWISQNENKKDKERERQREKPKTEEDIYEKGS